MSFLSLLGRLPWGLMLVAAMYAMAMSGIVLSDTYAMGFVGAGVLVLIIEFTKSTDIRAATFFMDQLFSVIAVAATAVLFTLMLTKWNMEIGLHYYYGAAIILADALLSPFNAFRTSLRNFGLGND